MWIVYIVCEFGAVLNYLYFCSMCGCKKGKVFPYSLPSIGPGADPGVQAVSPQVTWSESRHRPGSAVTFCQACGYLRSFHQMALPVNGSTHLIPALLLIYRPRKDERQSWPSWLTCSGWFTHISGHPSAAGQAQDRESSPVRDRRSATVYVYIISVHGRASDWQLKPAAV